MTNRAFGQLYTALKLAGVRIQPDGSLLKLDWCRITPDLRDIAAEAKTELARFAQGLCWQCGAGLIGQQSTDEMQEWCSENEQHFNWTRTVVERFPDGAEAVSTTFTDHRSINSLPTPLEIRLQLCLEAFGLVEKDGEMLEVGNFTDQSQSSTAPADEWPSHLEVVG